MLNVDIIDDVVLVTDDDAMETSRQLAKLEGFMCGISCGAAAWAAVEVGQAAGERRQADRRRPARPGRTLPVDEALSGMNPISFLRGGLPNIFFFFSSLRSLASTL